MAKPNIENFEHLLQDAVDQRASDLLLVAGYAPHIRLNGVFKMQNKSKFSTDEVGDIARALFDESQLSQIESHGFVEVTREIGTRGMARISVSRAGGAYSISARILADGPLPTPEQANLPQAALKLLEEPNGLIIVAGESGSGKTTTLYALVEWINQHRMAHICTVESPRHYRLQPAKAVIQQREVGKDVSSSAAGIAAAMHQDLDVLMLGEVKDFETLGAALHAAETGHLVIMQMHSVNCADAVERLIDASGGDHRQVRRQLAKLLRGVIFQKLLKGPDGKGRVPVCEVLIPDYGWIGAVSDGHQIGAQGMPGGSVLMKDELAKLEARNAVDLRDAKRLRDELGE